MLNQIEQGKESTSVLVRRVIDNAHLFTISSVGRTLSMRHFPKLEELLTTIKLTANLDDKKIVGLCFAMALSNGRAFEALSKFVKDVPKMKLDKIRLELQHHLLKVHRNRLVAQWIHDNYDNLDRNVLPVIEHANTEMDD